MPDVISRKLDRLTQGERPRVLDLFAGCGGLSLGFHRAGFVIGAAVELDPLAAASHAQNFHRDIEPEAFVRAARARDITVTEPDELTDELGLGPCDTAFDVLVGGPPCQAYARVGRAKLREVAEHPEAFKVDPRANLYLRYIDYVRRTKPLAILMENVPDILNFGGHNVVQEIAETLSGLGYEARYTLINSAFHGVPQFRDRVFLLAYHRRLGQRVRFPKPTHWADLPSGYAGTRAVAFKLIDMFSADAFVPEDVGTPDLPQAVSASEAIGDLPPITLHLEGKLRRGARRFTELQPYSDASDLSPYARSMRSWPGFESIEGVYDHVIRCLPRDTMIFRAMKHGDEYPAAHATAVRLFEAEVERRRRRGELLSARGLDELKRRMVPPYPVGTFPNRWWKLRPDQPSRTLMAHIGKDTYSHIHYDSDQGRTISVREAARLQSFPDGFVFCGTMNPAFRQIGNAVPPLMANRLASVILRTLKAAIRRNVAEQMKVAAE
ncbi:DNA cytosine methyltransferase [Blastochloris sulfoviridis]|uniref:DNA (cytosine-5-)-methyltransferase n=1 Tax=Blastochloris sulfoviridis TaxID=50712 RepID=A0A5M6I4X4_9HYPH|nr:DNA cytosine methyltransferase [Blastochloris sulfoviridis]KAA5602828.1 DNA cytosine methyltransferase [Blastochloris sulfoviridis]